MPLAVGRPQSVAAAMDATSSEEKTVIIVAQRDGSVESPAAKDLFEVGTTAIIRKM